MLAHLSNSKKNGRAYRKNCCYNFLKENQTPYGHEEKMLGLTQGLTMMTADLICLKS